MFISRIVKDNLETTLYINLHLNLRKVLNQHIQQKYPEQ